jgi:CRP-like cAMP-binding protein
MALRDARIARMPAVTFMWLLDSSLPFTRFLLMQLNERLGQFIGMVENDRLLNPDTRVARALASMFNSHLYPGLEKLIQISQEELGFLSGASRQRAHQALHLLENKACCAWITAASAYSILKVCAGTNPEPSCRKLADTCQ